MTTHYLLLLLLAAGGCCGDTERADHLLLLETLPEGFSVNRPTFLDVRTNYSGTVRVVESSEFRVVVNISAPDLQAAYKVQAKLYSWDNGLLLQVSEKDTSAGVVILTWLGIAIAGATILVAFITSLYSCCWYRSERSMYDMAEKKSVTGSSQRGVYRSRNSLQVVNLPPLGELPIPPPLADRDDLDGLHNDDSLKQVPEMPLEEEAEAIEMEELTLLKLKDLDHHNNPTANEDDGHKLTPQERNLIKNQLHSQGKNVHKDLLKKDKPFKQPARRRTANGLYTGVSSGPESGSADEAFDSENETDLDLTGESVREASEPNYENTHSRKPMSTFVSPQRHARSGIGNVPVSNLEANKRVAVVKPDNSSRSDQDQAESGLQVMADVHKTGTQAEVVKVTTPDKQNHPGFGAVLSPDTPRPTLTTFSSPAQTAVPGRQNKAIRFKEPEKAFSKQDLKEPSPPPPPPPVAPKPHPAARFAPVFPPMGDIPEDPREDCDSVRSGSVRSRSLYGSSEIFDVNNPEHTYYNLEDSDIDIPPLDAEDFLSDGGLPSPMISSLGRDQTRDDSSLKGPRSMFFGRDSSLMGIPKPRPYSSIIIRSDLNRPGSDSGVSSGMSSGVSSDQTPTPVNSEADPMSPHLPPPPVPQVETNQDVTAFSFPPPPPRFYTLPQKRNSSPSAPGSAGEYVTLPNNSVKGGATKNTTNTTNNSNNKPTGTGGRRGGGGGGVGRGGRLGFGSTFTNLTVLSLTCFLGLTTGVYSKIMSENKDTNVDITIFAPASFLSAKQGTVHFNLNKETGMEVEGNFNFEAFVMKNPVLRESRPELCASRAKCEQGCDVQTGECICRKGYRLIEQNTWLTDSNKCVDVNECAEGFTNCHPSAGCLNSKGSYDCVCSVDYYGDGKTCHDCNTPCRDDQYEVQPCSKTSQKICKECTKVCHNGYYMATQCTGDANAVCRVCQPSCLGGQYEYRTCSNYHDRQCKNATFLPDVNASDNVILEEDRKVKDSEVIIEHLPRLSVGYTRYSLTRGTGMQVEISIQDMEAAQQFEPLDLKGLNITTSTPPNLQTLSVQRFCPHPVPSHYILHYTKHVGVTYQLDEHGDIKPCHTYTNHGTFPDEVLQKDNSYLCREPGSLTKLFEIPADTFQTSTHWAERTKRCEKHSEKCEQCTRKCAQNMVGGSSDCSIIGDNNDNGWSPRLRVCYNCCARSNCTEDCHNYHRKRCRPLKCHHGNLVEFSIFPAWNSDQSSKFFCHIKPVAKQRLLEMTYTVKSSGRKKPVHQATIKVDGGQEWEKHGRMLHRDKLLNILIDSHLGKIPDFLEGRAHSEHSDFHVGSYIRKGSRVETTVVSGESVRIHPLKPSGVSLNKADPQKCENDILKESLVASEHQKPYNPNHDLIAVALHNSSTPFIITHLRQPPTVRITADKRSFLNGIFPSATLTPGSLTGKMAQNDTHWIVEVTGRVEKCPGYLRIVLSDPAYRSTPLFTSDAAVMCPRNFHLHFYLPSGDSPGLDRQVVASVADVNQVHHLRLHRPAKRDVVGEEERKLATVATMHPPAPIRQKEVKNEVALPEGFIFSIPYMVSVGGAVVLFLCLLVIGHIVQPGVPAPEPPILRCHHAFIMVVYVVFQFVYSIVATASVFFLVIIAVNSPRVAFIQQHQQQAAATSASHQLELTAMQMFLDKEMTRQNKHMDSVRGVCQKDMSVIVADMKKVHSRVTRETEDMFHKHKLELLLEEHRHRSMQQLAQNLLSFRDKYNRVVRILLLELNHNIEQAHQSIANNTWLAGARFLHGVVTTTRKHIKNVNSKPFMEWTHLQNDLSKLTVDVSFSLPSLPKLADIEEAIEAEAQPNTAKRELNADKLHTTHVYNQWFSPFADNFTTDLLMSAESGGGKREEGRSFLLFYVFLGLLACVDVVLVLHRMLKAKIVGQLLLYGFPEYMDFRERKDDGDDEVFDDNTRCRCWAESTFCQAVKAFMSQFLSSTFIPKAVTVVAAALLLRGMLHVSTSMLTVRSLQGAGLYYSSEEYLELHSQLINGRLRAHAHHINTVDFPAYQTWMSTVIQRHQFAFQVYQQELRRMQKVHTQSYCQYLQALDLPGNCTEASQGDNPQDAAYGIISPGCQFQPVLPRFYKRSESVYRNLAEQQLEVVLKNLRAIIFDTCQVIVVFLSIVVLKELISAVVWIFVRRSGLIRLRIIYETDQDEPAPSG
ncbi:uncharacterized protein [Littorina saxatilis]|uniref:Uncharacterized protein n=1 Tax=Littorina saxatilis TaxID=31220 RepID=A0AAN9APY0_9CAEN